MEENIVTKEVSKKSLVVLCVLSAVIYAVVTVLTAIIYFDVSKDTGTTSGWEGLGLAVAIVLLITYGSIANIASTGLSIAGLAVSVNKGKAGLNVKGWKTYFIFGIILPIVTELVFFVLLLMLNTN